MDVVAYKTVIEEIKREYQNVQPNDEIIYTLMDSTYVRREWIFSEAVMSVGLICNDPVW